MATDVVKAFMSNYWLHIAKVRLSFILGGIEVSDTGQIMLKG